jgi:hypothetical protein
MLSRGGSRVNLSRRNGRYRHLDALNLRVEAWLPANAMRASDLAFGEIRLLVGSAISAEALVTELREADDSSSKEKGATPPAGGFGAGSPSP